MNPHVRVSLLGGFSFEYQGASVQVPSQRLQSFVALLALHRPEPLPRQRLAFLLWPDSSEAQARTNLRTLLHRLQALLPELEQVISIQTHLVRWQPEAMVDLDVQFFETALRAAATASDTGDHDTARQQLEQAMTAYTGDLMPDCYDEWVLAEREQLRQKMVAGLEQLITLLEARRQYHDAIAYAQRLVQADPLNEAAYLRLMRLHLALGERASAVSVYHTLATQLQKELRLSPGAMLQAVYEQALAAEDSPDVLQAETPLVGRHREWQRMQALWRVVASGQPRLMLLSGEAGIGKTRLANEFLHWVSRQGILTAAAECYPAEGRLAYAEVTALLRSDNFQQNLDRLDLAMAGEIGRLLPELLTRRPETPHPSPLRESWQRQRFFEALARAVLGPGRPVVILVDDLHWCSQEALEWLHFLLRFDRAARLLVVGTVRDDELDAEHPLMMLVGSLRLKDRLIEIPLGRLSQDETGQLARHVVGAGLSGARVAELHAETEGNPLFVIEMLRATVRQQASEGFWNDRSVLRETSSARSADLPAVMREVISARLGRVAPTSRAALEAAAIIGRSFNVAVLQRTSAVAETELVQALDELWQRRILREQGPGRYDFTHEKLRAVAYADIRPARRATLHRRAAQALEAEHGADLDAVSGEVAAHYERAGDIPTAVTYYQQAAAYARRLYANTNACSYYQRAIALLGDPPPRHAAALFDQLGEVTHLLGRYVEAREVWQRALGMVAVSDRITRAALYRKLGNAWRDQYDYEQARQYYDAAQEALGHLHNTDVEEWLSWAEIECERISMLYWLRHSDAMLQRIEQVSPILERTGARTVQARLHQLSFLALLERKRFGVSREAVDHVREYLRLLEEAGDLGALPAAHFQLGFALLWAGDLASSEEECAAALQLAERSGDISLEGRCLTYLTVIARKREDVDTVKQRAERSLRVATTGQMPSYIGAAHGNLAWLAWRRGDLIQCREHGFAAIEAWEQATSRYMFEWIGRWPLIGLALMEDELQAAIDHVRSLLDTTEQRPPPDLEEAMEAAVQAADTGDLAAVQTHLDSAAHFAREQCYL